MESACGANAGLSDSNWLSVEGCWLIVGQMEKWAMGDGKWGEAIGELQSFYTGHPLAGFKGMEGGAVSIHRPPLRGLGTRIWLVEVWLLVDG